MSENISLYLVILWVMTVQGSATILLPHLALAGVTQWSLGGAGESKTGSLPHLGWDG